MVTSSARRFSLVSPAALLAVLVSVGSGYAKCDPSTDPDKSDIANARAAVAANCDCVGALTHGAYVSCAAQQANGVLTNKSCVGAVKKCASHSTCGKPGAVTCCLTTTKGTKCKIKRDAPHCTAKQGTVGSCTSCCDACPAPGSGPSCPAPTTTTTTVASTTTTTTMPTGPCQCGTPDPTRLQFTTAVGTGNCGVATKNTGTKFLDLACGGLYVGGGTQSFALPVTTPDMGTSIAKVASCASTSLTLAAASSLDTGSLRTCTQAGCLFGAPLPVPNANAPAISSCVINSLATDLTGTADCGSGTAALNVQIKGEVFITGDLLKDAAHPGIQPCPLCEAGVCHGGPNDLLPCTPDDSAQNGAYPTSHDCPPPSNLDAMVMLSGPASLTTGTVTKTAATISGQVDVFCGFCRDSANTGCFEGDPNTSCPHNAGCTGAGAPYPCCSGAGAGICDPQAVTACTSTAGCTNTGFPDCEQRSPGAFGPAGGAVKTVTETGAAGGNLTDHGAHGAILASIFCIPPTFSPTLDTGFDLPGPGAVTYPGVAQLVP